MQTKRQSRPEKKVMERIKSEVKLKKKKNKSKCNENLINETQSKRKGASLNGSRLALGNQEFPV